MGLFDIFRKPIQAAEGNAGRQDPLTPPVISTGTKEIRKNNFRTYSSQIEQIYNGYTGWSEYGSDLIRPSIDMRTGLTVGDGISVNSENKQTRDFIDKIIKDSKFYGAQLVRSVEISEKEGKCLLVITKEHDKIIWKPISWYYKKYTIVEDDKGNIKGLVWGNNAEKTSKVDLTPDKFEYVVTGAETGDINISPPRIGNVLTQIENYDRALYDMRENNHLFGRSTPFFETENSKDAKDILDQISAANWKIGKAIAAAAKFSIVGPGNEATDPLTREMSLNLKIISSCLGIPVHWFGWTDLMSNRAVAEELSNFIDIGTKKERLIWSEAIVSIIQKSMVMAIDSGIEWSVNDPYGFQIDIPYINKEKLKEIIEVWLPLRETGHISEGTLLNKMPGINPNEEIKNIEDEEKKGENDEPDNFMIGMDKEFLK